MIRIRQTKHLLRALDTSVDALEKVLSNTKQYYKTYILHDPARPNKLREVISVCGELRTLQSRLYKRVLLPKLVPTEFSHGGIKGRSIKTNAEAHRGSAFIFKADISNFYPSIHHSRVYRLFANNFECSPDVSRICTRLCTYNNHLALGLVSSPILADQILRPVDRRLAAVCESASLKYTRFVDDITISGTFDIRDSGFAGTLCRVLRENGFRANPDKFYFSSMEQASITNVRIKDDHLDITKQYADELDRQLSDVANLINNEVFDGPYYTPQQILGRIHFVRWINPGRFRALYRRFRSIPWMRVSQLAKKNGLIERKKTLEEVRKPDNRPEETYDVQKKGCEGVQEDVSRSGLEGPSHE